MKWCIAVLSILEAHGAISPVSMHVPNQDVLSPVDDEKSTDVNGIPSSQLLAVLTAALIRHGVNLSVLTDEDVKLVLRHVFGYSVTEAHLYDSIACPVEQKLKQWVCFR